MRSKENSIVGQVVKFEEMFHPALRPKIILKQLPIVQRAKPKDSTRDALIEKFKKLKLRA